MLPEELGVEAECSRKQHCRCWELCGTSLPAHNGSRKVREKESQNQQLYKYLLSSGRDVQRNPPLSCRDGSLWHLSKSFTRKSPSGPSPTPKNPLSQMSLQGTKSSDRDSSSLLAPISLRAHHLSSHPL